MSRADDANYVAAKVDEANMARKLGLDVYLLIDYFVEQPYHGPPPHHNLDGANSYPRSGPTYWGFGDVTLTKRHLGRHDAFGYMHFAWGDGWRWGAEAVRTLVDEIRPDYVQQGNDPETLHGWDYYKPGAGPVVYNDTMGVFRDGIHRTDWDGVFVVSAWKSRTLRKAVENFGKADTVDNFRFVTVPYVTDKPDDPKEPPLDSPRDELMKSLEEIEQRGKKGGGTQRKLVRIEKDLKVLAAALRYSLSDHDLMMDDMFGDD
jgi:hypothetical protein